MLWICSAGPIARLRSAWTERAGPATYVSMNDGATPSFFVHKPVDNFLVTYIAYMWKIYIFAALSEWTSEHSINQKFKEMKKVILFAMIVALGCLTISCTFSKKGKLESKVKTEMKKEAKLNGVKLTFNELECIELDTIPNEFNTPYIDYMCDANHYLNESECRLREAKFALRWGDYDGKTANELASEADSLVNLADTKHNAAMKEYSLRKRTCYLVYVDALTKIANVPIRTQEIALYTYNESKKNFDMLYHWKSNLSENPVRTPKEVLAKYVK